MKKFSVKKNLYYLLIVCGVFMTGCDKDDESGSSASDPAGTVEKDIVDYYGGWSVTWERSSTRFGWVEPNHLGVTGGDERGIYHIGKVQGLGAIRSIPAWNNGEGWSEKPVACQIGHGYIVRYIGKSKVTEKNENGEPMSYLRMYVVDAILSNSGDTVGAKVKYQYPFEP